MYGASPKLAHQLERLSIYFSGKHVTSNLIEQEFSSLKRLINFGGNRPLEAWNSIFMFYFSIHEYPGAVEKTIENMKIAPQIVHRSPNLVLRLLKRSKRIISKSIKVVVP
ncbi:MAG: hypothetical protein GF329_11020 [Candidatus Lokiarchaeota archaeon]|nr:hypothetical protein [Candidatus Lokiarchaeota archaeon]